MAEKKKRPSRHCIVFGCLNCSIKRPDLSFFSLPKDIERRRVWLISIDREDLLRKENLISKNYEVCAIHFDDSAIRAIKHLKPNAVPTLFLPNQAEEDTSHSHTVATSTDLKISGSDKYLSSKDEEDDVDKDDNTAEEVTERSDADNLNIEANRKRALISPTELEKGTKKSRHLDDIDIDYDNIDKFGEQIAFLLKRLPRKLCRHLQSTIVSLIKIETKNYEISNYNKSKNKRDSISSTSSGSSKQNQSKSIARPILSPTLERFNKHKESEQLTIPEETVPIDTIPDEVMKKSTVDQSTQATQPLESQLQSTDQRFVSRTRELPKPMTLPLELAGSMDCVKQEVLDSGESSNITVQDQCIKDTTSKITLTDPLGIDIKIEDEDMDSEDSSF